eukprot:COSAG05_NODE_17131_length_331_cov_0.883621_1_plen_44_part_10
MRFHGGGSQKDFVAIRGWKSAPDLSLADSVNGPPIDDIDAYVED